ncbi:MULTISPECIES: M15 family metallopeptidase [Chromohalobacter]|uniref:M15 family metallopeptidase n=1 Tax=Chromohalobacter TaxID=42054 RepID=UPI001FBAE604|nr:MULTISPECIES: M15 family metallopeptidase [Chromohalobacter]MCI0509153.1 M15 family metallopeptidase [Chromohalobacter sp.]MCI0592796.1 M15 family metallopeptidase [Chromohalobacter sp.]
MTDSTLCPIEPIAEPQWETIASIPIVDDGSMLHAFSLAAPALRVHPIYHALGVPGAVPECWAREAVYRRLLTVARRLPDGLGLVVLDAWRPYAVQRYLYDTLLGMVEARYADLDESDLRAMTRAFVSPPSDRSECPSPHLTGGAVDVALCDADGMLLEMGSAFDEARPASHTVYFEHHADNAESRLYRDRRRILYHAMHDAGFANLPCEWWHYSYGDQMWAWYRGSARAVFGATSPDSLEARWRRSLGQDA